MPAMEFSADRGTRFGRGETVALQETSGERHLAGAGRADELCERRGHLAARRRCDRHRLCDRPEERHRGEHEVDDRCREERRDPLPPSRRRTHRRCRRGCRVGEAASRRPATPANNHHERSGSDPCEPLEFDVVGARPLVHLVAQSIEQVAFAADRASQRSAQRERLHEGERCGDRIAPEYLDAGARPRVPGRRVARSPPSSRQRRVPAARSSAASSASSKSTSHTCRSASTIMLSSVSAWWALSAWRAPTGPSRNADAHEVVVDLVGVEVLSGRPTTNSCDQERGAARR